MIDNDNTTLEDLREDVSTALATLEDFEGEDEYLMFDCEVSDLKCALCKFLRYTDTPN